MAQLYRPPSPLFSGTALVDRMDSIIRGMQHEIENADLAWLQAQTADDLVQRLYNQYAPVLPFLRREEAGAGQYEAFVPPSLVPNLNYTDPSHAVMGSVYTLEVPFTGDREYFRE